MTFINTKVEVAGSADALRKATEDSVVNADLRGGFRTSPE